MSVTTQRWVRYILPKFPRQGVGVEDHEVVNTRRGLVVIHSIEKIRKTRKITKRDKGANTRRKRTHRGAKVAPRAPYNCLKIVQIGEKCRKLTFASNPKFGSNPQKQQYQSPKYSQYAHTEAAEEFHSPSNGSKCTSLSQKS